MYKAPSHSTNFGETPKYWDSEPAELAQRNLVGMGSELAPFTLLHVPFTLHATQTRKSEEWVCKVGRFSKRALGSSSSMDPFPTPSGDSERKTIPLPTAESWDALATGSVEGRLTWDLRAGSPKVERGLGLLSEMVPGLSGPLRVKVVKRQRQEMPGSFLCPFVHPRIHACIHASMHPSIHPCVHPFIYLCMHPSSFHHLLKPI